MSAARTTRFGVLAVMLLTSSCTQPPLRVAAWIVEWRDAHLASAIESLAASDRILTEIDFFRFHFDPDGKVTAAKPLTPAHRSLARVAAERGIRRLATVVNDTVGRDGRAVRLKDPEVVHRILRDPARRRALVAHLEGLVRRDGYDGIDVDFEKLYARDREAFSAFIAELAPAIHAGGGRVVVTVHPRLRDEKRDGPGAQDLAALAESADEIRVMAYHVHYESTEPGPSAPRPWLERLIEYNLKYVPARKLSIAVYVGGWRWSSGHGEKISYPEAMRLSRELGARIAWSDEHQVPFFQAAAAGGPVVVWFENACSLLEKGKLAASHSLGGIALWHLGNEDPALFRSLTVKECEPTAGRGHVAASRPARSTRR